MAKSRVKRRASMKWEKGTDSDDTKSLFLPRTNKKLAEMIVVTDTKAANKSIKALKEWHNKKGTRNATREDIRQATIGTANIAKIMAENPRNSSSVRAEKARVANLYNDAYKDLEKSWDRIQGTTPAKKKTTKKK